MILGAFSKALAQLLDPRFRRVLLLGVGLTLGLLIAAYALVLWLVSALAPQSVTLPFVGEITWIRDLLSWGSVLLMSILSIFLMMPVAAAFTSLFLDDVAEAVEDRHYPSLPPVRPIDWADGLRDMLNFLGVMLLANTLALALYLMLPFLSPLIFWALNGFLLGREYFQLVALRRMDRGAARALFRRHRGTIWLAGTLMAIPLSLPLASLLIPILGAATFTHIFHRLVPVADWR